MLARLDGAAGGFMITRGILVQGGFFLISLRVMIMMKVIFKCANQFKVNNIAKFQFQEVKKV